MGQLGASRKLPAPGASESLCWLIQLAVFLPQLAIALGQDSCSACPGSFPGNLLDHSSSICLERGPVQKPGPTGLITYRLCPATGHTFRWCYPVPTEDIDTGDKQGQVPCVSLPSHRL